ncbi:nitroreductase family protein [Micromonospora sp. HM5-17]|uniref:Acg family FMN-binding oxidoreductase n=1 Tax=Micromonospora sp. HM5-17 TaxID=2487710 RepID=UPI001F38CC48|nr:nitroreductase family protein [Micromonospora sp. HM5-17]
MIDGTYGGNRSATDALARAAENAAHAPSVHNTQPWHWRVEPGLLELSVAEERQLGVSDPDRRLLTLSCGAALHHARITLVADGWAVRVDRLPDPARPNLLARITPTGQAPAPPDAAELVSRIPERHTDRRPVSDQEVPPAALDAIVAAAAPQGAQVQILDDDEVIELAAAAGRAGGLIAEDPALREELAYWTSRAASKGAGLPAEVLLEHAPQTTVPARDFGRPGTLPVGPGHDQAAVYGILFGDEDEPESWLRAGEALSAAWLTATRFGVSMVPLSGVIEVPVTRQILRQMLAGLGQPYLALRLGLPDPAYQRPVPRTPRLPTDETVERPEAGE